MNLCCIAMNNYTYTYACRNIFNIIKTSGQSSLEKYTSHFIERVVYERWVGDGTELQHIDPPPNSYGYHSLSFLFSWAAQPGAWGPSLCDDMVLIPTSSSPTDLNFLSSGLYNNLTPTYFLRASQFALNSTPWQSRSPPDIFDRMHLLFTQVHFFFWQFGQG